MLLHWGGMGLRLVRCLRFEVRDGWLCEYVDEEGKPIRVVTEVDGSRFNEFWLRMVTR